MNHIVKSSIISKILKTTIFLFISIFILSIFMNINAQNIEPYHPTKEELGGEIFIPSRDGGWDNYSNIDNYEQLYAVLEDLSSEYIDLREEYNSLESNNEEKESEISELEDKLEALEEQLKGEQIRNANLTNSNDWILIFIPIIIFGIPILVAYLRSKSTENK